MRDFSNIYSLDQANKWMKVLNSMYNTDLDIEDIHRLFQKFGVWFKTKNIDGKDIKFYNKSNIVDLIGSGHIKKEIDNIIKSKKAFSGLRKLPISYSNPPDENSEKVVKRGGRNIILPNKPIEATNDDSDVEYRNGENDMEGYSRYLIDKVYQFENKNNTYKKKFIKMAKKIIKESELRQIIEESVKRALYEGMINEDDLEEGIWDNLKSGFKGAFGGDVERAKQGIENGANAVKNFGSRMKQGATDMYNNAKQGVQNAAKGVGQRVDAFKANYQAGQNADKINSVISTLRDLQNNGVISGAKTNATIDELERCLNMSMKGMRGRATQVTNRIGK